MDYKIEYFPFAATKEELYKKGPIVTKLEEYIRAAAQSPVSWYAFLIFFMSSKKVDFADEQVTFHSRLLMCKGPVKSQTK